MLANAIRRALVAAGLLLAVNAGTAFAASCTDDGGPGGDWPLYGHDLNNTRVQSAEDLISAATVSGLKLVWASAGSSGTSTAVASGRCVYMTGADGFVRALDIESGAQVWEAPTTLLGSDEAAVLYALSVDGGRVYVNSTYSDNARMLAFDANTGQRLWTSNPLSFGGPRIEGVTPAQPFDGMVFEGGNGPDADPKARPGYQLLDAASGQTLHAQTVIPTKDLDAGYAGGATWAAPAIDETEKYLYIGTANPYSKKVEHRYDDAIIKIDIDPTRATFGTVVDSFKGEPDSLGFNRTPVCDNGDNVPAYHPSGFSTACAQLDIDFAAAPNLWHNKDGELMVGELQKDGIYHAVYAKNMSSAWNQVVGGPQIYTGGNSVSSAYDGKFIYTVGNGGLLSALDPETGRFAWNMESAFNTYSPIAVANGVVFNSDTHTLWAHNAADGSPLWATSLGVDSGKVCGTGLTSGGVSIAHHTVIANCDGTLTAYRLS